MILAFLAACGASSHQRLDEVRIEKESVQRYLTVCGVQFPNDHTFCSRKYGARLHELICEEAHLQGEKCTHRYEPD